MLALTIFLALFFGFLGGALGAVFIEVYLQRMAHNEVGDHDLVTEEEGRRHAR
jgi:hypothetical protein